MSPVREQAPALQERTAVWCRHHWLIEDPAGPVSRGVCKHCGAVREFKNYVETPYWTRNEPAGPAEEPLFLEVEVAGETSWDE